MNIAEHDIRALAYTLWQGRGCPFNHNPDEDWMESERILTMEKTMLAEATVQMFGATDDPLLLLENNVPKIGLRNDYQHKISFVVDGEKLCRIDDFRILGELDYDILCDFNKCYPKCYGNFQVTFRTGSVADHRGEVEANCFYLSSNDGSDDAAYFGQLSLCDALNGTINPFAPMHRTGPIYSPYLSGTTNFFDLTMLIPYRIVNDSSETIWCKTLEYHSSTGLWRSDDGYIVKLGTTSSNSVFALFDRM